MLKVILFLPFKIILSPAHFAFHLVLVRPLGQINYLHSMGFKSPGWVWLLGAPWFIWNVYLWFGIFWQLIFTIQWIFTKKIEGENFFFTYDYQNRE